MKIIYCTVLAATGIIIAANANDESLATHTRTTDSLEAFNPVFSATIDGFYYHEDSREGINHIKEEVSGFGHAHDDEHGHGHGVENGFNLRELELWLSAEVDNYFRATAITAIEENDIELEVATVEAIGLTWGLKVKAGKFFSDFGYINAQHPHQWDFVDQPLIYELTLGDHGLNEKGVQVSWLAPTPIYLLFGAEALQGENEKMFVKEEEAEELPENDGPRLGVGWVKLAPLKSEKHELQLGLFGGSGNHQEIHDEGVEAFPTNNYFDGINWFAGADAIYQYDSGKPYGQGDAVLQAEYFFQSKELDLKSSDDPGAPLGGTLKSEKDGYYIQGTYGILPRWQAGLRWEQIGSINDMQEPDEAQEKFDDSWRASAMIEFHPTDNSQIRFQINRGDFATEEGTEKVWESYLQLTITLGAHGKSCEHSCTGHHH